MDRRPPEPEKGAESPEEETGAYGRPLLYDIAFGYRDFRAEVDALAGWYASSARRPSAAGGGERSAPRGPLAVLELASGPSDHAIEWARRGAEVVALDRSRSMCEYASAKAELLGVAFDIRRADMVDFQLGRRFDLALLMMNSIAHIHTVERLVEHLRTVSMHLHAGGIYVLEIQHPRHFVGRGSLPVDSMRCWRSEGLGLEVEARWGSSDDPYDPLRQLFDAKVEFRVWDEDGEHRFVDRCVMRDWSLGELEAAVGWSGAFEIAALHGAFEGDAGLGPESERLIAVLRALASRPP